MIGIAGCGQLGASLLEAVLEAGTDATGFEILEKSQTLALSV
ncbi:MAG: hypothetical protein ABJH45_03875 [Paracoccaceae bacterium]